MLEMEKLTGLDMPMAVSRLILIEFRFLAKDVA